MAINDPVCSFYCCQVEDGVNLFIECKFACGTWQLLGGEYAGVCCRSSSWLDWVVLLRRKGVEVLDSTMIVLWGVQEERCSTVFEGKR